jgi:hypothetical protein
MVAQISGLESDYSISMGLAAGSSARIRVSTIRVSGWIKE